MNKKHFSVALTASATVGFYKSLYAENEEEAKQLFAKLIKDWMSVPELYLPDILIQEPPSEGHDFEISNIEVEEETPLNREDEEDL